MARNKQIPLFDGNDTIREIKKHSSIVHMGNMTTLQERKTMNALIWIAKDILKRNPNERVFHSDIGLVKNLSGLNDTNNVELKNALRNLADTKIEYNIFNKEDRERGIFSFLASARIKEQGRWKATYVTFEFPSMVLDVIKHPDMFVRLNLLVVRGLDSKHSIALYEFLKDYIGLGKFRCKVEDFRRMMGIQQQQYRSFTMIRKRVLDVAVDEINTKTDIEVNYDLENQGRKIISIHFKMYAKKSQTIGIEQHHEIKDKLLAFGLKKDKVEALLRKHDEQYLRANISIVEQQMKKGKVKNPTGYLLKAFDSGYNEQITEYDKILKEEQAEKERQFQEEQAISVQEEKLKQEFKEWRKAQVEKQLKELSPQTAEEYRQQFLDILLKDKNSFFAKLYQSKGFDYPVIQHEWYKFLTSELLAENDSDFDKFKAQKIEVEKNITL